MTGALGQAALALAKRGLAVFPLQPRKKIPLKDSHGFKDASTGLAVVEMWWHRNPRLKTSTRRLPSGVNCAGRRRACTQGGEPRLTLSARRGLGLGSPASPKHL
jgi:bifunctional DNA primase/polymerase-like protein